MATSTSLETHTPPQVEPRAAAPVSPVSAPATEGNQARLAALLPTGPTSVPALVEALGILGDAAATVLDALPVAVAAEAAWAARGSPWVAAWLEARPARRLRAEAARVWALLVDHCWPRGQAVTLDGMLGAEAVFGASGATSIRVDRDEAGFRVGGRVELTGSVDEGVGTDVGAAGGELLAGAVAGLELAAGGTLEAAWRVGGADPEVDGVVGAWVRGPEALAAAALARVKAGGLAPESWRFQARVDGKAAAAAGVDAAQGRVAAEAGGAAAVGMDHDRGFVEVHFGAGLSGRLAGSLVDRLTAFGELSGGLLEQSLAVGLTLRAEGAPEALAVGDFSEAELVLTDRSTRFLTQTADTLRTHDFRVAAGWLRARLVPGGTPFGAPGAAREVPVAQLPELTLVRSVERPVVDLDRIDLLAPSFLSAFTDALPDHGLVVGLESAEAAGSVVVGPAAMRAAAGPVLSVGESAEEAVLAVERRIAAAAMGGTVEAGDLLTPLDVAAGVAAVETRGVTLTGRARLAAGGGGELGLGAKVEGSGEVGVTVERSVEVGADPAAARTLLLTGV